jgi:hypothetical protein
MKRPMLSICSTSKPCDDPRMYQKLAHSFGQTNKYEINIIGFGPKNIENEKNISFYSIKEDTEINNGRLQRLKKIMGLWRRFKPSVLVICSPDLLIPAIMVRLQSGCRIIYDMQENYPINALFHKNQPFGKRHLLAFATWLIEIASYPFLSKILLAEKVYLTQKPILARNALVLENKFAGMPQIASAKQIDLQKPLRFIYTGTMSKLHGTDLAIDFFLKIHQLLPTTRLTLIGHCHNTSFAAMLRDKTAGHSSIRLQIEDEPIAHKRIITELKQSDLALISYKKNKSFKGKIPTKYYECAALAIPMLIHHESPYWLPFEEDIAIRCDFNAMYLEESLNSIKEKVFFKNHYAKDEFDWHESYQTILTKLV